MWMSGDDVNTEARSHFIDCVNEIGKLNNGKPKNRPHGIPYRAAQIRAARCFPDEKRIRIKCGTVSDKNAKVFRVRQSVDCDKQFGVVASLQNFRKRGGLWNAGNRHDSLVKVEAND
jgi:hypothetical protein